MTMPSTAVSQRVEPLITQALSDIGIDVTWEPQPPQNTSAALQSRQYPAVFWFQGLGVPARELQDRFTAEAFFNPFRVPMPEISELVAQVGSETDPAGQRDLYQEIGRISVEEAFYAPILYVSTFYATKDGIEYLSAGAPNLQVRRFGVSQ